MTDNIKVHESYLEAITKYCKVFHVRTKDKTYYKFLFLDPQIGSIYKDMFHIHGLNPYRREPYTENDIMYEIVCVDVPEGYEHHYFMEAILPLLQDCENIGYVDTAPGEILRDDNKEKHFTIPNPTKSI